MIDTAQFATDMAAIIDDLSVSVIFGDKTIKGCVSVLDAADIIAAAGELKGYRESVYCVIADWADETPPDIGDLITADGTEYRVLRMKSDVVGVRYDVGEKYSEND